MDVARDEAWVRESARSEDECGGRIEAGLTMKAYAQAKYDDSLDQVREALRSQMRVQAILFVELRCWMEEWDIGSAFDDTYPEARQLVRAHLKQPAPEQKAWVEAVLEEDQQQGEENKPVRAQTRAQLVLMLTDDDWKVLAQVAANAAANLVFDSVRQVAQVKPKTTVAA